jgi:type II restriction enzyme
LNLNFDNKLAGNFTSNSQKTRILTEDWVLRSVFCPNCGEKDIFQYPNNRPVADFFCSCCNEDYELKSKSGKIGKKIVDGAYSTMIERLNSDSNPNFFMLSYDKSSQTVRNFLCVPKHFFIPKLIEMRRPLSTNARRAGWIGCNILLENIPESGKVYFVREGIQLPQSFVLKKWKETLFLRQQHKLSGKGWVIDILLIIEKIGKKQFTLEDIYRYESELAYLHPENNHIKDKIRQQLQVLRDKNYLQFLSRGVYRLINSSI